MCEQDERVVLEARTALLAEQNAAQEAAYVSALGNLYKARW
jgi:hypothetical protein